MTIIQLRQQYACELIEDCDWKTLTQLAYEKILESLEALDDDELIDEIEAIALISQII